MLCNPCNFIHKSNLLQIPAEPSGDLASNPRPRPGPPPRQMFALSRSDLEAIVEARVRSEYGERLGE